MTSSRRRFLMSGTTALVASPAFAFAQRGQQKPQARDSVLSALASEMARAAKIFEQQPAIALATLATNLRVLAAHGPSLNLDRQFEGQLRASIRSRGKAAVASDPIDLAMVAEELRPYGVIVNPTDPRLDRPVNVQRRMASIDALLSKGVTTALLETADHLATLAASAPAIQRVRRQPQNCQGMGTYEAILETTTETLCLISLLGAPELCVTITIIYVVYRWVEWLYCGGF